MEFPAVAEGKRGLEQMGLGKLERFGVTLYSDAARDISRMWIVRQLSFFSPGKAIVRVRSATRSGQSFVLYNILCEGSDVWCKTLQEETEADLRFTPPPPLSR